MVLLLVFLASVVVAAGSPPWPTPLGPSCRSREVLGYSMLTSAANLYVDADNIGPETDTGVVSTGSNIAYAKLSNLSPECSRQGGTRFSQPSWSSRTTYDLEDPAILCTPPVTAPAAYPDHSVEVNWMSGLPDGLLQTAAIDQNGFIKGAIYVSNITRAAGFSGPLCQGVFQVSDVISGSATYTYYQAYDCGNGAFALSSNKLFTPLWYVGGLQAAYGVTGMAMVSGNLVVTAGYDVLIVNATSGGLIYRALNAMADQPAMAISGNANVVYFSSGAEIKSLSLVSPYAVTSVYTAGSKITVIAGDSTRRLLVLAAGLQVLILDPLTRVANVAAQVKDISWIAGTQSCPISSLAVITAVNQPAVLAQLSCAVSTVLVQYRPGTSGNGVVWHSLVTGAQLPVTATTDRSQLGPALAVTGSYSGFIVATTVGAYQLSMANAGQYANAALPSSSLRIVNTTHAALTIITAGVLDLTTSIKLQWSTCRGTGLQTFFTLGDQNSFAAAGASWSGDLMFKPRSFAITVMANVGFCTPDNLPQVYVSVFGPLGMANSQSILVTPDAPSPTPSPEPSFDPPSPVPSATPKVPLPPWIKRRHVQVGFGMLFGMGFVWGAFGLFTTLKRRRNNSSSKPAPAQVQVQGGEYQALP